MIFFVWNDFFGIHRLQGNGQEPDAIPKFMCQEAAFKPETLTTGDRMYISSFTFYKNDGRIYRNYPMPKFWVTDRINNLFMLCIDENVYSSMNESGDSMQATQYDKSGDMPGDLCEYWLIINNQPVRIAADFDYEGNVEDGFHVSWNIAKVIVPSVLYYISEAQLQKIIKKAFEAYAYIILEKNEKDI